MAQKNIYFFVDSDYLCLPFYEKLLLGSQKRGLRFFFINISSHNLIKFSNKFKIEEIISFDFKVNKLFYFIKLIFFKIKIMNIFKKNIPSLIFFSSDRSIFFDLVKKVKPFNSKIILVQTSLLHTIYYDDII